jgi:hypothetical protein
VRLLGNALIALSMRLFGRNEIAAALPSLFASLALLGAVLYWCFANATLWHAFWAGLLLAVLPIDVEAATTISPYPLMVAFATIGTLAFLTAPESPRARWLAAAALSLAVVTHLSAIYYVASLAAAALVCDVRRFWRAALATALTSILFLVADMAVFQLLYGDALCRFRASVGQSPIDSPEVPLRLGGKLNATFFTWPVGQFLYSKAFGVSFCMSLGWLAWRRRALPLQLRIVLTAGLVYWLWMSYGTQIPWAYRPFYRITRFWQPLTVLTVLAFACMMTTISRQWLRSVAGGGILGACVLNLLASGSWGQNMGISRELSGYARQRAEVRFVTDYHTLNEMYVLNEFAPLRNVVTLDAVRPSQLLDGRAVRVNAGEVGVGDAILVNPLNLTRTPHFAAFVGSHAGIACYESTTGQRLIAALIPPLRGYEWSVRKPPARVYLCANVDSGQSIGN